MATSRSLRPRKNEYDNEAHGQGSSFSPDDDHTLDASVCRSQLVRPNGKKGPMIVRPWPALDFQQPDQLVPGRKSINAHGINHFAVRVRCAAFIGMPGGTPSTFLLYEPWAKDKDPDKVKYNPYEMFFRACKAANKAGNFGPGRRWNADWNKLMIGGDNKGAPISAPTAKWFMQGAVYVNGDKDYTQNQRQLPLGAAPEDNLVVIQLSVSGGDALLDLIDKPKADYDGVNEKTQPWRKFAYGDPTGIPNANGGVDGGLIVGFFNPKVTPVNTPHTSYNKDVVKEFQGFECFIGRDWTNPKTGRKFPSSLSPEQAQRVRDNWQFWFADASSDSKGLLKFYSNAEQCRMIAQAYKAVPQLVEFALGEHEDFDEEAKAVLRDRRSAVMPGGPDEYVEQSQEAQLDPTQSGFDEFGQPVAGEQPAGDLSTETDQFADPVGELPADADPAVTEMEEVFGGDPVDETPVEGEVVAEGGFDENLGDPGAEAVQEAPVAGELPAEDAFGQETSAFEAATEDPVTTGEFDDAAAVPAPVATQPVRQAVPRRQAPPAAQAAPRTPAAPAQQPRQAAPRQAAPARAAATTPVAAPTATENATEAKMRESAANAQANAQARARQRTSQQVAGSRPAAAPAQGAAKPAATTAPKSGVKPAGVQTAPKQAAAKAPVRKAPAAAAAAPAAQTRKPAAAPAAPAGKTAAAGKGAAPRK